MQTVMNHRFGLCIPKELLAQESNTKKKPCPPPKPDCLCPFLSLRFEGVFEESLTVSDSFLQHAYSRACRWKHALFEHCTQSGASRPDKQCRFVEGRNESRESNKDGVRSHSGAIVCQTQSALT